MELVFATNNLNKLREIRQLVGNRHKILSLQDINCVEEIPETHDTLEGNAAEKAFYIYNKYGCNCFADDTGLEIEAIDGRPGVYSARYAGEACSPSDNIEKVLNELNMEGNRKAKFRTVVSLVIQGEEKQFQGAVEGEILTEKKGQEGFGYDPIFQPEGFGESFAQMSLNEKNRISHRANAVRKLVNYLNTI